MEEYIAAETDETDSGLREGNISLDSTIIAAIIGGIFALVVAIIQIYSSRTQSGKENIDLPRFEIAEGLSVVIGIVQKHHEVLLVKRRSRIGNLSWQFPAGIVKPGMDLRDRVENEVKSETGVTCKFNRFLGSRLHCDTKTLCQYAHCLYVDGEASNMDPDENDDVRWVKVEDVRSYITSNIYIEVNQLLNKIESGIV